MTGMHGFKEPLTRGDLQLIRRAIIKGWDVPADRRPEIVRAVRAVYEAPESSDSLRRAAARTIEAMQAADARLGRPS